MAHGTDGGISREGVERPISLAGWAAYRPTMESTHDEIGSATSGPHWMSTAEAAELLGVQARTLYRFIDEGRLPAYRFGRVIRVIRDDVLTFVESCRIEPGTLSEIASTSSTAT